MMSRMPTELLATFSRSVRSGLHPLAMRIHRNLDSAFQSRELADEPIQVYPIVVSFNLCALLEVSFGRPDRAEALCESAIQWLGRRARASGSPSLMCYAFQPWINLTRLARYQRDWVETARRLDLLKRAYADGEAHLGGVYIAKADWHSMCELVPNFDQYLLYNWVQQELLCAIQLDAPERITDAASFCGENANALLRGMLTEAQVILGIHEALPESQDSDQRLADVIAIRKAQNAAREHEPLAIGPTVEELDAMATRLLKSDSANIWELAAVQAVLELLEPIDAKVAAKQSASAFDLAQRIGDEVFGARFAASALRCGHPDPSLPTRVRDFEERSWHAPLRRKDHPDEEARCAIVDRVSSRLFDITKGRNNSLAPTAQPTSTTTSRQEGSPTLLGKLEPDLNEPTRAIARFRFAPQRILSLGPALGDDAPEAVRAQVEALEFTGQQSFAAKPLSVAIARAEPTTQYLLRRVVEAYRERLGSAFEEDHLSVTVRVDRRDSYVQMQQAHIDWARTTEFHEEAWIEGGAQVATTARTFDMLGGCSSVDCVLGGPATDFFLGEHHGTLHLVRQQTPHWTVDDITFDDLGEPTPGAVGELIFRPPYTIHQFPPAVRWTGKNAQRLFVSCDFHAN